MGYKNLSMVILISMLVVTAYGIGGGGTFSTCIKDCMPICMSLRNAKTLACNQGCALGCQQLQGKGNLHGATDAGP